MGHYRHKGGHQGRLAPLVFGAVPDPPRGPCRGQWCSSCLGQGPLSPLGALPGQPPEALPLLLLCPEPSGTFPATAEEKRTLVLAEWCGWGQGSWATLRVVGGPWGVSADPPPGGLCRSGLRGWWWAGLSPLAGFPPSAPAASLFREVEEAPALGLGRWCLRSCRPEGGSPPGRPGAYRAHSGQWASAPSCC